MKKYGPALGLLLLLCGFAFSLWQVGSRRADELDPDIRVLRIGHWLIHAGMREAMDAVIADYEALHPDVRIRQNTVPIKSWHAWQRAQWTGGTTPDLMQLGKGTNDDTVARYYHALTPHIEAPNPYNAGSPLEGLPWRQTFVEGLNSGAVYFASFSEVFGIPAQVNTLRLYYNKTLLSEITGSDRPPSTPEELFALRAAVQSWRQTSKRPVVPLSLCGPYGEFLFDRITNSLTQPLALELNPTRGLGENGLYTARAYLENRWSLRSPAAFRTLEYWAEVAALAAPGYHQLPREEAMFNFVTGNAVLFYGGSWDYAGVTQESRFPVGVTTFPLPVPGEGRWGEFSLGPVSEAEGGMEAIFGISRDSRHPELALDFLRFFTSHRAASKFTEISRRLSAIIEVPAPPELAAMQPQSGGAHGGVNISLRYNPGGNAGLLFNQNIHRLDARNRSAGEAAEDFVASFESAWPEAIARDLEMFPRSRLQLVRQGDVRQTFALLRPTTSDAFDVLAESSLDAEIGLAQMREPLAPR
ncbi:MAG: extracellular solute-binding protein [Opitutaceae bacterium]|jgi:multiple sugar transport system substrate-binding protein/raffinose/stachyose/melibiose transport system substrate-binding protein|nr:extracellular solute-binding protein [Opitutaceae bacterium]